MEYRVIATAVHSRDFDKDIIIETKNQDFNEVFKHPDYIALKAKVKSLSKDEVVAFVAEYKGVA